MLLYIIRHGETAWNALGKIQGTADIPLNENGINLAKQTAEQLKDVPFDAAISSPLMRAYKTAEIILGDRDIPIETDKRIQEIDFGDMEGEPVMKTDPSHPFYTFLLMRITMFRQETARLFMKFASVRRSFTRI